MGALNRNRLEVPGGRAPQKGQDSADQRVAEALRTIRGRVPNAGTTILDFGPFPGASDAVAIVTGQTGIIADSVVQAWLRPEATPDHAAEEHLVEPLRIVAGTIVPGVGFSIYGLYAGAGDALAYGKFTVAWSWT